jgi:FAD/FMN-containing dehydrogenase
MLVRGTFGTVSVGGYNANGGHGKLSAKYGLGADQVLEINLITPKGEIITANKCQNTDYFWAMRGGRGSTYGVVVAYVLKGIPTVRTARYSGSVSGWDEITHLHKN